MLERKNDDDGKYRAGWPMKPLACAHSFHPNEFDWTVWTSSQQICCIFISSCRQIILHFFSKHMLIVIEVHFNRNCIYFSMPLFIHSLFTLYQILISNTTNKCDCLPSTLPIDGNDIIVVECVLRVYGTTMYFALLSSLLGKLKHFWLKYILFHL